MEYDVDDLQKSFVDFNEILQKAINNKDNPNLVKKVIINKQGDKQTVYVDPHKGDEAAVKTAKSYEKSGERHTEFHHEESGNKYKQGDKVKFVGKGGVEITGEFKHVNKNAHTPKGYAILRGEDGVLYERTLNKIKPVEDTPKTEKAAEKQKEAPKTQPKPQTSKEKVEVLSKILIEKPAIKPTKKAQAFIEKLPETHKTDVTVIPESWKEKVYDAILAEAGQWDRETIKKLDGKTFNNGCCMYFAETVNKIDPTFNILSGGQRDMGNIEQEIGVVEHIFLEKNGKYYDFEAMNGVDEIEDLPYIQRQKQEVEKKTGKKVQFKPDFRQELETQISKNELGSLGKDAYDAASVRNSLLNTPNTQMAKDSAYDRYMDNMRDFVAKNKRSDKETKIINKLPSEIHQKVGKLLGEGGDHIVFVYNDKDAIKIAKHKYLPDLENLSKSPKNNPNFLDVKNVDFDNGFSIIEKIPKNQLDAASDIISSFTERLDEGQLYFHLIGNGELDKLAKLAKSKQEKLFVKQLSENIDPIVRKIQADDYRPDYHAGNFSFDGKNFKFLDI